MGCEVLHHDHNLVTFKAMDEGVGEESIKDLPLGKLALKIDKLLKKNGTNDVLQYTNFLFELAKKRNYWCHNIFVDLIKNSDIDKTSILEGKFAEEKILELDQDYSLMCEIHRQTTTLRNELAIMYSKVS